MLCNPEEAFPGDMWDVHLDMFTCAVPSLISSADIIRVPQHSYDPILKSTEYHDQSFPPITPEIPTPRLREFARE